LQDQLVVKLEADNVLPYDSQLFFFNGIGLLLSATKDKKLQQDTLKVLLSIMRHRAGHETCADAEGSSCVQSVVGKFLDQVEEILAKEIYKQDTVERPVCANFLQQIVAVVTALSSGTRAHTHTHTHTERERETEMSDACVCVGFGSLEGQSGMEELLAMWSRTSHVALRIVAAIPQYPDLRLKVLKSPPLHDRRTFSSAAQLRVCAPVRTVYNRYSRSCTEWWNRSARTSCRIYLWPARFAAHRVPRFS
jgi:hypothetical protein